MPVDGQVGGASRTTDRHGVVAQSTLDNQRFGRRRGHANDLQRVDSNGGGRAARDCDSIVRCVTRNGDRIRAHATVGRDRTGVGQINRRVYAGVGNGGRTGTRGGDADLIVATRTVDSQIAASRIQVQVLDARQADRTEPTAGNGNGTAQRDGNGRPVASQRSRIGGGRIAA